MSPTLLALAVLGPLIIIAIIAAGWGVLSSFGGERYDISSRVQDYAVILPDEQIRGARQRQNPRLLRFRIRMNAMLSILSSEELNSRLIAASWQITGTEFVMIRIASIILGFTLGSLIAQSMLSGIGLAIIAYLLPDILLKRAITTRRKNFNNQLVDVLVLINGAVRAGYSLLQSLDLVIEEMPSPASDEFRRVRREVGLGISMNDALDNLNDRMQNDDLYLVITAIKINAQVGGNLSTMLASVTETIRDRVRLLNEVRSLTSEQRFTGQILSLLPFIVGGFFFLVNPTYMVRLFDPGVYLCIPIGALIGIILGNIIIRQLVKIDV